MIRFITTPALFLVSALLTAHPAQAANDYSTDMDEVDIATVKAENAHTLPIKQESNVRLRVQHAIYAVVPLHIEVLDENHLVAADFKTRDRVIYMRLPQGHYSIRINGIIQKKNLEVDADDSVLKSFAI